MSDRSVSTNETAMDVPKVNEITSRNGYEYQPLWIGPSKITTIRTGKAKPFQSLLKTNHRGKTAINKQHRTGPVYLGRVGFDGDEQNYYDHGGPEKAVLQFNPNNYLLWHKELRDVMVKDEEKRASILSPGAMGENIAVSNPLHGPPMDEHTVCVGDVIEIRNSEGNGACVAKIRITGPRQPCNKLNHRFGIANMSHRAQSQSRTGWLYSVPQEGNIEVGDQMVLVERPYPEWPVARVQYYLYAEPRNFDMIKRLLDEIADILVYDVRDVLKNRLEKGVEDMSSRLNGSRKIEKFIQYRLSKRTYETQHISDFVFDRIDRVKNDSSEYALAEPGSHIRLRIRLPGRSDMALIRPYSIISGDSNGFRLGVALSDTSRGGSSYLHTNLSIGDVVEASETIANTFPLMSAEVADTHIFLAGGIGITAFLDHIRYCLDKNITFQLHYMVRSKSDTAYQSLINSMLNNSKSISTESTSIHIYDSGSGDRCDVKALLSSFADQPRTHIYTCGSERLSNAVTEAARKSGIPETNLHFEQFSIDASGDPFTAILAKTGRKIDVRAEQSLLEALRETGLEVPSSCEAGNCGTCKVRVKCGKVTHRGTGLTADEKAGEGEEGEKREMLSCVSRGVGTIEIEI